jgi:hypothetical protein
MEHIFVTIKEYIDSDGVVDLGKEIYLKKDKNYINLGVFKELQNQNIIISINNQILKKNSKECFLKFPVIKIKR